MKEQVANERRMGTRRSVRNGARMVRADGSLLGTCVMVDLSGIGACLKVETAEAVPDEFVLVLSHIGRLRRQCSVVWRSDTTIGVAFIRDDSVK
jgi:hypothetical protein